ncbi:hypothetical protein ACT3CD_04425 [Geofilum sp. OHC36d9]|uniref:hypothetical protein n=1 Tax=Geofilum sp. OHC36d9 TaxID=3458413 RepID=UPI0040342776
MSIPVFTREELAQATRRDELIRATAAQIIKDFNSFNIELSFSGNADRFYDELVVQMEQQVDRLLQQNNALFMGLLYRIDISERDILLYESEMKDCSFARVITELIIHREIKKVLYREYIKKQ